ncbi:MAG TPA: aromatic ring-hydroxylating dioxygenase subunit alpha [Casimicrobiaceae bacterium]|jgi:phenylpropionate dioxygenase-like ring-hydroxylating dioxygenase large terminal subunit
MRSILAPSDYTSPAVLAAEERCVFRRLWIVAGFRATLDAPDAFLTHRIGGVPIVVQNTASGLKAFVNRCAHRQSAVQTADFGQRRLACPYHGWVYDDAGRVKSIPGNEANYGLSPETVSTLRLEPVALRVVGGLVFVNLDPDPLPLEEQFHPAFIGRMEQITGVAGDDAMFARIDGRYNWKLAFENVIDWNHVPFVHPESFAPLLPKMRPPETVEHPVCPPPVTDAEIEDDLRELSFESSAVFDFPALPWHDAVERCADTRTYVNLFIYPNVNYMVMAGVVHSFHQSVPIAPDRTEVRMTMALGKRNQSLPAAPAILWGHLNGEKRVADEDLVVFEGIQHALADASPHALHGHYEYRLRRVAKVYRRLMAS